MAPVMHSDPTHPLNFMTTVEGETYIPISVTAVVAFGFVSSAVLINAKPWSTSPLGAWETPAIAITKSSLGGPWLLLLFRLYTFIHLSSVMANMYSLRGLAILYFYTNWTFVLEAFYFLLASLSSAIALRKRPQGRINLLGLLVVTIFPVLITAIMVVDVLHWGVLWPILRRTRDPNVLAHHTKMTFSWNSYNTHVLNFLFILIELFLNNVPFHPYLVGFGGLYSSFYGLWAFSFYTRTHRWIYPFLNASKPWSPYVYVGIYVGHWAFFGLTALLFKLRDRLLGRKDLELTAGDHNMDKTD